MKSYQLLLVDDGGRVAETEVVQALSDDGAITAARRFVDGHSVEIWDGKRKLSRVDRHRASPSNDS